MGHRTITGFILGCCLAGIVFGLVLAGHYDNPWWLLISVFSVGGAMACGRNW